MGGGCLREMVVHGGSTVTKSATQAITVTFRKHTVIKCLTGKEKNINSNGMEYSRGALTPKALIWIGLLTSIQNVRLYWQYWVSKGSLQNVTQDSGRSSPPDRGAVIQTLRQGARAPRPGPSPGSATARASETFLFNGCARTPTDHGEICNHICNHILEKKTQSSEQEPQKGFT